jgi:Tfp pilus assembly ATPase PilU
MNAMHLTLSPSQLQQAGIYGQGEQGLPANLQKDIRHRLKLRGQITDITDNKLTPQQSMALLTVVLKSELDERLVELDLLEQFINSGRQDIVAYKLQRLSDLAARIAELERA